MNIFIVAKPIKIWLCSFFGLFFYFAVHAQTAQFCVAGRLSGLPNGTKVSIQKSDSTLDSCMLENGRFVLSGSLAEEPALLHFVVSHPDTTLSSPLFIGNETVEINAALEDFPYHVGTIGSTHDSLRMLYNRLEAPLHAELKQYMDELTKLEEQGALTDSVLLSYMGQEEPYGKVVNVISELQELQFFFTMKHVNSYYGLYLLDSYKSGYSPNESAFLFDMVQPEYQSNRFYASISDFLGNVGIALGDSFLDFDAVTVAGDTLRFSEQFGQKKVLLCFGTIYCEYCMRAIPDMVKMADDFKDHLDIVTLYVDSDKDGFVYWAEQLGERIASLWDQDGRNSKPFGQYKVAGTPRFFLFDTNGTLLKKIDGYKTDLYQLVKESL